MTFRVLLLAICLHALSSRFSQDAAAAPPGGARYTVMRVEGGEILVDVGTEHGVKAGSELRLYHAIRATHPVTKRPVRDTFYVGTLRVVTAGRRLSVCEASPEILLRVTDGDEIELPAPPRPLPDPWDEAIAGAERLALRSADTADAPGASGPAESEARARVAAERAVSEAAAVDEAWRRTLGRPVHERIAVWKAFLEARSASPWSSAVSQEIAALQVQAAQERAGAERRAAARRAEPRGARLVAQLAGALRTGPLVHLPPTRVYQGSPIDLSYLTSHPRSVSAAWVHYRRAGETTYERLSLVRSGDGTLRVRLPDRVAHPPHLEYFVEVLPAGAERPTAVYGDPSRPARVAVDATVEEPPPDIAGRSRVTVAADFVDFDARNHLDEWLQAEADFMYRFRRPVYAMRLGLQTLRGTGGPKAEIQAHQESGGAVPCRSCRSYAVSHVYVELELRLGESAAVMLRPLLGKLQEHDDPLGSDFGDLVSAAAGPLRQNLGFRGRVRVGSERETNLAVGGSFIGEVGNVMDAMFTWDVIPRFPIVLGAQVTNMPAGADYGVRLVGDLGWRRLSWFYPSMRVSYAARDLRLQGFGAGLAANFDW